MRIVEEQKNVTKMVAGVEKTELKTWKFFELSGYEWLTNAEILEKTHQIGSGLRVLGLKPGMKLTIFAPTWLVGLIA